MPPFVFFGHFHYLQRLLGMACRNPGRDDKLSVLVEKKQTVNYVEIACFLTNFN